MKQCSIVVLFVLLSNILTAQSTVDNESNSISLRDLTEIERDMTVSEIHSYAIDLDTDRFLYIRVQQLGIDLIVKVFNPQGTLLEEIDSPTGTRGDENVFLITESAGEYKIEIHPYDPLAEKGKYKLVVEKEEEAATTPGGKTDQLFAPWDKKGSPGAVVAVVRDGRVVYKNGFGEANLEYHIPITPKTIFHMASVSKQFTAYAIAVLAQQGKISFDDDIRKYIPEIPDFGEKITISHLIHHTSGLRDQWNLLAAAGWRLDDVITRKQILRLISKQKELNFPPGEEFMYCNTGYTLMAEIVARVSGISFPQWTKENIFDPLNMNHTLFYDDHEKIVENRAYSYSLNPDGSFKKSVLSYANVGATSLFTTAEDLSKWAMNFDDAVICDQELIDQMEKRGVLNNGDTIAYAFGQGIGQYKSLKLVSHSGGDAGYRTYLGRFPDQKFSVLVMSNLGAFNPRAMALKIADLYLENFIPTEEESQDQESQLETVQIDPQIIESYAGLYELYEGARVRLVRDGYRLLARVPREGWQRLFAISEKRFSSQDRSVEVEFSKDPGGYVDQMIIFKNDEESIANRVEPFSLNTEELQMYTGRYYSEELQTTYELTLEDSILVAHHQRHDNFIIQPQSKETFNAGSWAIGEITFERDETGQITAFRLSSGRVRNLLFVRQ
jgi:CubicO group peptidase (beta-lactamase class C family)